MLKITDWCNTFTEKQSALWVNFRILRPFEPVGRELCLTISSHIFKLITVLPNSKLYILYVYDKYFRKKSGRKNLVRLSYRENWCLIYGEARTFRQRLQMPCGCGGRGGGGGGWWKGAGCGCSICTDNTTWRNCGHCMYLFCYTLLQIFQIPHCLLNYRHLVCRKFKQYRINKHDFDLL